MQDKLAPIDTQMAYDLRIPGLLYDIECQTPPRIVFHDLLVEDRVS